MLTRRNLLVGIGAGAGLFAAPAIVRATSLMPVAKLAEAPAALDIGPPEWHAVEYQWRRVHDQVVLFTRAGGERARWWPLQAFPAYGMVSTSELCGHAI